MERRPLKKPQHAVVARDLEGRDVANRILLALPAASWERVKAQLIPIDLAHGELIISAGMPVNHLYFINRGLVSLVKRMKDGRSVEIGGIGIEGVVGLLSLYGIKSFVWDSIVQIDGEAFCVDRHWLQGELTQNEALHELLQRSHFMAISQATQMAACNRLHSLRQRCCFWLLTAHDNVRSDTFTITHQFLAMMLGAQRVRLSILAMSLQNGGIIRYTRGRMTIVNRFALERSACECYRTIHAQLDRLFCLSDQF
jgi:CRP-like cAMP-binding protein